VDLTGSGSADFGISGVELLGSSIKVSVSSCFCRLLLCVGVCTKLVLTVLSDFLRVS
jgi:hypothetical protein